MSAELTACDRMGRVVPPQRLLDPKAGPLIAVKLHILTRKTLGGIETDLDSRVLKADGTPIAGLYAAVGEDHDVDRLVATFDGFARRITTDGAIA